jgi:hypothetical protein
MKGHFENCDALLLLVNILLPKLNAGVLMRMIYPIQALVVQCYHKNNKDILVVKYSLAIFSEII